MGKFAIDTTVSAEKSRVEIEQVLMKYGASKFGYMHDGSQAKIGFEAHNRHLRFIIPIPLKTEKRFWYDKRHTYSKVSAKIAEDRWAQEVRQRWRALLLAIRAKLEAVEVGLSTFEDEFLPYTILPDGKTVSEWIQPQIAKAYSDGKMPQLMITSGE